MLQKQRKSYRRRDKKALSCLVVGIVLMSVVPVSVFGSSNSSEREGVKNETLYSTERNETKSLKEKIFDNKVNVISKSTYRALPPGCVVDLKNQTKAVHAVVLNCSEIGMFSLGGYFDWVGGENWLGLLYGYPNYGSTSYLTVRVGEKNYCTMPYPENGIPMDPYLTEPPQKIGEGISTKWRLPEDVTVEQTIQLVQNSAKITVNATNENASSKEVGVRLLLRHKAGGRRQHSDLHPRLRHSRERNRVRRA